MLPHSAQLSAATLRSIMASGHSRIPVYQGTRHQVIGLLLVKELLLRGDEAGTPALSPELLKPHAQPL